MTEAQARDAGLTLVEVLVALAIFAVIGLAGLGILDAVVRTSDRTDGRLERMSDIDRTFLLLRRDLAQVLPRGLALDADGLAFSRSSETGPVRLQVALQDGVLQRAVALPGSERVAQSLLDGVAGLRWRVMDGARRWHSDWPPGGDAEAAPPLAAELQLDLDMPFAAEPTSVTRLFAFPAGLAR